MPVVSTFFGIIVRMYYEGYNPPYIPVEFQGNKAVLNFCGNILKGELGSRTALKLVREWIDLCATELTEDWDAAVHGQAIKRIDLLD